MSASTISCDTADYDKLPAGQLIDTYSKQPYETNPMDKQHGLSIQESKELGKRSQGDIHGTLQLKAAHSITAMEAGGLLDAMYRLRVISRTSSYPGWLKQAPPLYRGVKERKLPGRLTLH